MKKISLFILSVLLPLLSSAANSTLSIEPLTIGAGETKTMFIDLSNPDQQVTMVEFHMQLPQGLSIAAGDNAFDIAGRTNWQKHTLYSNEKDGLIHVMLASPTNALVSGTSGALISVRLTASSTFSGGTITLKNQKIGSPDMTVSKPADYSYTVQTPSAEAEPYVIYNNGTLTFYYDTQRSSRVGETYDLNTGYKNPGWYDNRESITKAVFNASFANARPTTTYRWFDGCENLTEIQGISYLNISEVTTMHTMFNSCSKLTTLNLNDFKTDKVTDMGLMFNGCYILTDLDLSGFNTDKVTDMSSLFRDCRKLSKLTLGSEFVSKEDVDCKSLFAFCFDLKTVTFTGDIPYSINSKFFEDVGTAAAPATLDVPAEYREHYAAKFDGNKFFGGYFTLSGDTPQPDAEPYVVYNNGTLTFYCDNQRSSRAGDMYSLNEGFSDPEWKEHAEEVATVVFDVSFANARPVSTCNWFGGCHNLTNFQGMEHLNTSCVTNMNSMFRECTNLTKLDLSHFNTTNVEQMGYMFQHCRHLEELDLTSFNTEKVIDVNCMFFDCQKLANVNLSSFNTSNVKYFSSMFQYCYKLTELDLSNFNTMNASESFHNLFAWCNELANLKLGSGFVSTNDQDCSDSFRNCRKLVNVNFTGDIPSSINSKFFNGVGTAAAPATLDVPAEYREHYAAKFDGNKFFGGYFTLSGGEEPELKDGDLFTDFTPEGVEMTFKVISAKDKTCQVGIGLERNYAINKNYSGYVTIPTTPKGFAVISVSNWALSECALKGVTVPEGVKEIGDRAFGFCYNLETISLPRTLTKIEYNILWYCPKLKSFRLPKSVTKCSMTFGWCDDLSEITVEEGNPVYDSRNNCNAIIEKTTNTLLAGCKTTIIPNSVKTLGVSCFSFLESLTEMQIPEGVTSIRNQAFAVTGIASVTIPSTVRTIGEVAFDRCQKLEKVTSLVTVPFTFKNNAFSDNTYTTATLYVPKGTKALYQQTDGWKNFQNIVEMEDGPEPGTDIISFADPAVKQICVSNWDTNGDGELSKAEAAAVKEIGTVFKDNKEITSFDEFQYFIGVKTLAYRTFYYCSNLKSIILPNSITEVRGAAFYYCPKLTSISFPDNDGCTLYRGAIADCHALTTVYLPKNTMISGATPFYYCSSLTAIEVDAANVNLKSVDGVVYTKNGESIIAYPCGKKQTEYTVLSGTKIINDYAFNYCRNLLKVTLPSTVEVIRNSAFSDCDYLTTINLPNSVITIGGYAFAWCYKLASITLPNSVTVIDQQAFWCCDELPSITIPASVTFIGTGAFAHCVSLNSIVVESGNTMYDSRNNCNAIIETNSNKLIAGCKNTVIPSSVTSIEKSAFRSCEDMTSIAIPNSVTSIGSDAFGFCTKLKTITIPESVTSIGDGAFYACSALKEVRSLISKPFAINDNVFTVFAENGNDEKFTSATLYVPKGTKALYQQTDGWKNFQNIVEMEDGPEPGKTVERRTVVEEGTGTWCGYCTRGMAFMKKAEDTYGDRFIGIAIHGDDPMDIGGNGVDFLGYPRCYIDRTGGELGIGLDVSIVGDALAVPTDIDVTVTGTWNADRTQVTATSTTEFLSAKQGCSVVYALTADGLRHSSWTQNNNYAGSTTSDPYMKPYTEAPNPITDIEFNHVLVASSYSGMTNKAAPFSGSISAGDKQQNSYTLTLPTTGALAEAINKDKVYVVAMVLNPDGTVANAAKAKVIAGGQPSQKKGDLNGDGQLNSTDLVMMVNMIMGKTAKSDAADLNGDGVLNSTDLVMLVNMIMGQ